MFIAIICAYEAVRSIFMLFNSYSEVIPKLKLKQLYTDTLVWNDYSVSKQCLTFWCRVQMRKRGTLTTTQKYEHELVCVNGLERPRRTHYRDATHETNQMLFLMCILPNRQFQRWGKFHASNYCKIANDVTLNESLFVEHDRRWRNSR